MAKKKLDYASMFTLRKDGRYQGSYTDDTGRHYVYDKDPEKLWNKLNAPKEEPVTLKLVNCVVTPRCGYEPFPFIEGENIREVDLTRTTCSGFLDSCAL